MEVDVAVARISEGENEAGHGKEAGGTTAEMEAEELLESLKLVLRRHPYPIYRYCCHGLPVDPGGSTSRGGITRCLESTLGLNSGSRCVPPVPPLRRLFLALENLM